MTSYPITQTTDSNGRVYYAYRNLKFSTLEVAQRHAQQAEANKARFQAAIAADTPEERAANMRAFFGIKD